MPHPATALPRAPSSSAHANTANPGVLSEARPLASHADRAALATEWQALEARAQGSFFTSWAWVGCWLTSLPTRQPVWLLRASLVGRTVGLAVVVRGPYRRLKGLPFARAWHWHASGDAVLDLLCVEHNDALLDPAHAGPARQALVAQWLRLGRGARELHVPNLGEPPAGLGWPQAWQPAAATLQAPLKAPLQVQQHDKPSYAVDLATIRARDHDLLPHLRPNLRSQLRRSLRAYAEIGPLTLEKAPDGATASAWFEQLVGLHQAHWQQRGQAGAFGPEVLLAFHRRLVHDAGASGAAVCDPSSEAADSPVELLRVSAGPQVLAYLYNFVHRGRVYFYQAGMDYSLAGKLARPGYVAQLMAIEHYARRGLAVYDFMMGESRYKQDLATDHSRMSSLVLRPPAWRFKLEEGLRSWRSRALQASTTPPSEPINAPTE